MLRSALLNVMIAAARKAGRSLKRDFGEVEHLQVSLKGHANFVSAADHRAEEILRVDPIRVEGPPVTWAARVRADREPRSRAVRLRVWSRPGSRVTWLGETFLPPLVIRMSFFRPVIVR